MKRNFLISLAVILILASLGSWALAGVLIRAAGVSRPAGPAASDQAAGLLEPGPWGRLHAERRRLVPARETLEVDVDDEAARWCFDAATPAELADLLAAAELSDGLLGELLASVRAAPAGAGYLVTPRPAVVRSLPPRGRAVLYSHLGQNPAARHRLRPPRGPAPRARPLLQQSAQGARPAAEAATSLSGKAEQLQQLVGRFKVRA